MKVIDVRVGEQVNIVVGDQKITVFPVHKSGRRVRICIDADKEVLVSNAVKK